MTGTHYAKGADVVDSEDNEEGVRLVGHHQVLQLHRPMLVVDEDNPALLTIHSNHDFLFHAVF